LQDQYGAHVEEDDGANEPHLQAFISYTRSWTPEAVQSMTA
jgi:hypothetical protein